MFRCELCGAQVAARISAQRVVLAWRAKRYPRREYRAKRTGYSRPAHDRGGVGYEIAREALACPNCARTWVAPPPPLPPRDDSAAPG